MDSHFQAIEYMNSMWKKNPDLRVQNLEVQVQCMEKVGRNRAFTIEILDEGDGDRKHKVPNSISPDMPLRTKSRGSVPGNKKLANSPYKQRVSEDTKELKGKSARNKVLFNETEEQVNNTETRPKPRPRSAHVASSQSACAIGARDAHLKAKMRPQSAGWSKERSDAERFCASNENVRMPPELINSKWMIMSKRAPCFQDGNLQALETETAELLDLVWQKPRLKKIDQDKVLQNKNRWRKKSRRSLKRGVDSGTSIDEASSSKSTLQKPRLKDISLRKSKPAVFIEPFARGTAQSVIRSRSKSRKEAGKTPANSPAKVCVDDSPEKRCAWNEKGSVLSWTNNFYGYSRRWNESAYMREKWRKLSLLDKRKLSAAKRIYYFSCKSFLERKRRELLVRIEEERAQSVVKQSQKQHQYNGQEQGSSMVSKLNTTQVEAKAETLEVLEEITVKRERVAGRTRKEKTREKRVPEKQKTLAEMENGELIQNASKSGEETSVHVEKSLVQSKKEKLIETLGREKKDGEMRRKREIIRLERKKSDHTRAACVRIQSQFRGHRVRVDALRLAQHREKNVQSQLSDEIPSSVRDENVVAQAERYAASVKLQSLARGRAVRRENAARLRPKQVETHQTEPESINNKKQNEVVVTTQVEDKHRSEGVEMHESKRTQEPRVTIQREFHLYREKSEAISQCEDSPRLCVDMKGRLNEASVTVQRVFRGFSVRRKTRSRIRGRRGGMLGNNGTCNAESSGDEVEPEAEVEAEAETQVGTDCQRDIRDVESKMKDYSVGGSGSEGGKTLSRNISAVELHPTVEHPTVENSANSKQQESVQELISSVSDPVLDLEQCSCIKIQRQYRVFHYRMEINDGLKLLLAKRRREEKRKTRKMKKEQQKKCEEPASSAQETVHDDDTNLDAESCNAENLVLEDSTAEELLEESLNLQRLLGVDVSCAGHLKEGIVDQPDSLGSLLDTSVDSVNSDIKLLSELDGDVHVDIDIDIDMGIGDEKRDGLRNNDSEAVWKERREHFIVDNTFNGSALNTKSQSGGTCPEWTKYNDITTNKSFYYNSKTGESQWDIPDDVLFAPLSTPTTEGTEEDTGTHACTEQVEEEDDLNMFSIEIGNSSAAHSAESVTNWDLKRCSSSVMMKKGDWQEYKDESTGETFYYNTVSQESQWQMPLEFQSNAQNDSPNRWTLRRQGSKRASFYGEWEQYMDEVASRPFYYNTQTGESTWDAPATFKPLQTEDELNATTPSAHLLSVQHEGDWIRYEDVDSNKSFYYNSTTGITQWENPNPNSSCDAASLQFQFKQVDDIMEEEEDEQDYTIDLGGNLGDLGV